MDCRSESGYFHVLGEDAKLQSKLLETRRGREVNRAARCKLHGSFAVPACFFHAKAAKSTPPIDTTGSATTAVNR